LDQWIASRIGKAMVDDDEGRNDQRRPSVQANPQQLEAILATDGPVLIIAGPGSGKTFTLVERIVYLITRRASRRSRCWSSPSPTRPRAS
jgi:ATP-dependent exoDNAse (exonuclease V) beta subunit